MTGTYTISIQVLNNNYTMAEHVLNGQGVLVTGYDFCAIFSEITIISTNLDDLQLDPFVRLYANETATDGVNDSIDKHFVRIVCIRLLASKLTVGNEFLRVGKEGEGERERKRERA